MNNLSKSHTHGGINPLEVPHPFSYNIKKQIHESEREFVKDKKILQICGERTKKSHPITITTFETSIS